MTTLRRAGGVCEWKQDGWSCALPKAPGKGRHYCSAHEVEAATRRRRTKRRNFQARRRQKERASKTEVVEMVHDVDAHVYAIRFMLRKL